MLSFNSYHFLLIHGQPGQGWLVKGNDLKCYSMNQNLWTPNLTSDILFLSKLEKFQLELHYSSYSYHLLFKIKDSLLCKSIGVELGQMRAALWVRTAMHGTLKVLTAMLRSAGRSSCISWWVHPVLLSVRTWLSCWFKQASWKGTQ